MLEKEGIKAIALTPKDTMCGSVESLTDAEKCVARSLRSTAQAKYPLLSCP